MSAKNLFRKLMTRTVCPLPTGTIRKAVSPLRRQVEGLEDRVNPATLNYDAATDILTFTADAGDTDNITVTAPAANSVVLAVANGDTLTLTGDATLANGFNPAGGNTVTIDTGLSPLANFNINLGDANDTIAFSLASTPNGVQNVSIDGQANNDTATIGATTITGNLAVSAESISSTGTATAGTGAGNSITLTADTITDGNAGSLNFVAFAGTLTITKSNVTPTDVDLDTSVGSLNATAATGSIIIDEVDGLTVTAANANGAGGAVTVRSATGNITVVTVNAATTASLTATAGQILDDANNGTVITAAAAVLSAGTNIGAFGANNEIDTTVATLTTNTAAGGGSQFLNETDGLTEISLNAGAGNVTLNAGAAILSADSAVDVTAGTFSVTTAGSIGSTSTAAGNAIETSITTLFAIATGGSIFVRETDAITLGSAVATGAGNDVSILNVTGDMTVVSVNADDDASLTATAGSILDDNSNVTTITGDVVALVAGANIGQPGAIAQIDTAAASVTASATTAAVVATPGIWIGDSDAVTITSATTTDGTIVLDAAGTMTVGTITAGGARNVLLRTSAGDIAFGATGSVTAAGDGVRLQAAGAITESTAAVKVTAASLAATAGTGIAAVGDPLNTAVTNLAAASTTNGVFFANTGALTVATVGPLFGVTVIGVFATGAGGAVGVSASSPLTIAANVTSAGGITLVASDSAAAGDDLTINTGVTVSSNGASITIVAGDNVSIPAGATVSAATTITINADQAVDPDVGVGSTVAIAGDLNATSATINGGADADTFNIVADGLNTITPITVNGGAPTTLPGDTLNYTGPSPATKTVTGPGAGTISAAGVGNVSYTSIETVASTGVIVFSDVIDLSLIAGGQDGNPNQVVLQLDAAGTFFQVLVDTNTTDNGGVPNPVLFTQQPAASTLAVTVLGGTDADTVVVRANASGALPRLTNVAVGSHTNAAFVSAGAAAFVNSAGNKNVGLHFDGGGNADTLRVELGATESVAYFSDTVDTANSGVVSIAGDLNLSFENLAPLVVVGAGGSYLVDASANATVTTMIITNSGTATDGVSTVDGDGTFEDTDFSGFATVTVRSGPGADTITLTSVDGTAPAAPAGAQALTTLNLDADDIGNTDASADVVNVVSLPATVDAFVFGGAGLDVFNIGTVNTLTNPGLLSPIQGDVSVNGEADGADLRVDGSGAGVAANYEITNNRVERSVPAAPLFGGVDYINLTTLLLTVGGGANVVNVISTSVPTTVNTNAGADTINVGGDGVNGGLIPALAVPRSLDGILGTVTIDGGGTGAQVDTVNINDQDDTGASTYGISATTITRTGAGAITYNVGGNTEVLNVNGSITAASNTFNVTGTSATQSTTVNDGTAATSGTATFNIQGDAQQATATHTYNGFGGADTFNVALAAGTQVTGTATTINGGDPASTSATRDRVNLNLAAADATVRTVGINYSTTGGSAGVTGLSTGTFDVTTTETIVYTGGTDNNDILTVTGSTNGSEVLSVTPISASEANVFLGGTPMLTVPPGTADNNNPGVAGGAAGPDLSLRGLAQATGLTINSGGGAGDRIVVNAPTESGTGVGFAGLPATGLNSTVRAANAAFDNITVNQNLVAIVNHTAGGVGTALVQTNVGTGFGTIAGQATLTVNTGDEAGVRPATFAVANGAGLVADDITALLSAVFRIQINAGTPPLPGGAPLVGDRLNIATPAEANVFSDLAGPPNVSITSTVAGTPTQPVTFNNVELLLVTPGNGIVNILGDNNGANPNQTDSFTILGRDTDSSLGGDTFGTNEFSLLINGSAPIDFRSVNVLNVASAGGDDDIVIDPYADTVRGWGIVTNVDSGAGDDDLVYGNITANPFIDPTPDGSQAQFNEAVTVNATLTPGAGSVVVPGAVSIFFTNTEDLSFYLNTGELGDTDTLTINTPDSAGVPERVVVRPDAAGTDADPIVDIDAITPAVQLLQIQDFALVSQAGVPFFALAIDFNLGNGADVFDVAPSANGTAINVNGGAPATGPGDTLDVRFAGTVNPLLSVTAGPPSYSGSWRFDNRAAINFTSFETIFPTVTVAATVAAAAEPATNGEFTFTRTGDTALPLTVTYTITGTATGGADYTALTGTVTFAAGSATAVVPVTVLDDLTFEFGPPETVVVTLAAGSQYVIGAAPANAATVTISDDDTQPTIALAGNVTAAEGAAAVFTVTLSNPSTQTITVQVATSPGTAVNTEDYTTTTQTLTFNPGQTSLTFSVATNDDLLDEADETFTVTLSNPTNATLDLDFSGATGTITDNDATPTVEINDVTANEAAGSMTFTVTLSAASGRTVTVDFQTADGTAVDPADYAATTGTLTFAPGETTKTITVSIVNDLLNEATETFTTSLTGGTNVSPGNKLDGVGTILDNDPLPTVSVDDVTVDEGAGTATFTVTLSAASGQTITLTAGTAAGTATAGADYTTLSQLLTFAPGVLTQTFVVPILEDTTDEPDETFVVNLTGPTNVTLNDAQGVGTITDNDATPTVSVSGTPTVTEGGTAVFTVTLSAASGQPVTVTIATAPVTAEGGADYVTATQTLSFAPGATTLSFSVATTDDAIDEIDETFTVTLSGATNATIDVATDTGTITDNDAPTAAADAYTVAEDGVLTVAAPGVLGNDTFSNPASTAVLVTNVASGVLVFNTDGSFTYTPNLNFNGTDSFTYQVDDGSGVNALSNVVTVTITVTPVNDDPAVVVPGDQTVPEDTAQAIPGISVSDPDLTNPTNLQFHATVTLTVLNGTLTIGAANGVTAFGSGTRNVSLTGSMAAINALLAQATGVVYQGNLNYNGPDTLTVSVDDHGNLGQGVLIADATVAINVTAVNDAPTRAVPGPQTATEDVSLLIPGLTVADVDAGGDGVVVTLTVTNGTLTAAGAGVAGSGTGTVTISGPVAAVNAALATVRYVGNLHFSGADTLNVTVSDVGNTGAGGPLTASGTVAITVVAVADAPTLTVTTPASGPEGSPIPLTIAAALVDTDGSESLSVVITGFPAGTTFSAGINDTTKVTLTPAQLAGLTMTLPDGAAAPGTTFTLQVTATATEASNGSAASTVRNITATVTNVAPTVTLTNSGPVTEGSTATVSATNQVDPSLPDVVAGLHYAFDFDNDGTFEVGNGTYAGSSASATATVPASLLGDGPGTRTVRVRVIDKDGGTSDSTTTITITNVAPTATFTAPPVNERRPVTVTFANPKDPSAADTQAGFTYRYDLNNDGVFEVGPTTQPTATFTPAHDGTFIVVGRIFDKDGDFTEYTANGSAGVVVQNVDRYAIGTGVGGAPRVIVYETGTQFTTGGVKLNDFFAYDAEFRGGVQVAVGDVTGDGVPDIVTGTGVGGGPHVQVFDGVTFARVGSFLAYEDTFRGGVQVAVGDVDGDGRAEIITGVGDGGGPVVKVFRANGALVSSFMAYEQSFRGGVNVGAADLDGDGRAEIITGAGNGGGPVVKVFDGTTRTLRTSFLAYEGSFRGGVNVAGGDLDGDGKAEIVTGTGVGGGPLVKVFSAAGAPELSVNAFGPDKIGGQPLRNGTRVAVHDIDGDGRHDVIAGSGPDYSASVSLRRGSNLAELSFFLPYEADNDDRLFTGGVYVG